MKKVFVCIVIVFVFVLLSMTGCLRKHKSNQEMTEDNTSSEEIETSIHEEVSMKVIIDEKEYVVQLEDNETVRSFFKKLPQTYSMSDLNNNEKYVYLDYSLPTNSYYPKKILAGDVMLYQDNCLVIFYESFDTTFSYTKIGHIEQLPDLGKGKITVQFE